MSRTRIPALDGIRGLAVIGVVLHHLDVLPGGYLGVDAFFVLSGYLITGILLDEATTRGRVDLVAFWGRRVKRLVPALAVTLAIVTIADPRPRDELLAAVTYVYNWWAIADGSDYWNLYAAPSPLRHLWSLAIEEQFYVVWPLLVALAARLVGRRHVERVTVALAAAIAVFSIVVAQLLFSPGNVLRVYYGTDTRMAAIAFGALAAVATRRHRDWLERRARPLGIVALVLVVPVGAAWIGLDGSSDLLYRGGLATTGLATTLIVLAAVHADRSLLQRGLAWRPLCWFGAISYGLYLVHWPLIVWFGPQRVGFDGALWRIAQFAAATAIAAVSFKVMERPVQRAQIPSRRLFPAAACALVALAVAGIAVAPPPISTVPTVSAAVIDATTTTDPLRVPSPPDATDESGTSTASATATTEAPPASAPPRERRGSSVMVLGDSGAAFLGASMLAAAPSDWRVLPFGEIGCGIANAGGGVTVDGGGLIADPDGCDEWPRRWSSLARDNDPDVALLVLSWPGIGDRDLGDGRHHPCDPEFDAYYAERLDLAIESAASSGATVAIVTNPRYVGPGHTPLFDERVDCLNASMRSAAERAGAVIVDLADRVCPDDCIREIDGDPLRPDGLHFDGPGGQRVARWVFDDLARIDPA